MSTLYRSKRYVMLSNQVLQETLEGLRSITRVNMAAVDLDGHVCAGTFEVTPECLASAKEFSDSPAINQVVNDYQFFRIAEDEHVSYVLILQGSSDENYMVGRMAVFQIQQLLYAYREHYDKDNFIKNLLLDNILKVDIFTRAEKLGIKANVPRIVYIIETRHGKDSSALETIRNLYQGKTKGFITAVDEKSIVLIRQVEGTEDYDELLQEASTIVDMLNTEAMTAAKASFGTIVHDLRDLSRSYKEAKMAMSVGKIFYSEKNVIGYSKLGIGRLIYQLPMSLCQMYIREVFGDHNPEDLDDETLITVNKFFDHNLNVSETSRELYIHRNTLVYRLDKLKSTLGLDLTNFNDAITFKIALMVVKYMRYMESRDKY